MEIKVIRSVHVIIHHEPDQTRSIRHQKGLYHFIEVRRVTVHKYTSKRSRFYSFELKRTPITIYLESEYYYKDITETDKTAEA
jgi:hypothetical protein